MSAYDLNLYDQSPLPMFRKPAPVDEVTMWRERALAAETAIVEMEQIMRRLSNAVVPHNSPKFKVGDRVDPFESFCGESPVCHILGVHQHVEYQYCVQAIHKNGFYVITPNVSEGLLRLGKQ